MMDLDEPADVYWPEDLSPNEARGAHTKSWLVDRPVWPLPQCSFPGRLPDGSYQ
jgi:hypothetical protein